MSATTRYFDCCAGFGLFEVASLAPAPKAEDLLVAMDVCEIERALVYHATQRDGSPAVGNAVVLEETAGRERLEPAWALLPPQTGEFPGPDELPARMAEAGVRALWAFPDLHKYQLSPGGLGGLLEALAERRIPLLVQGPDWTLVEGLLTAAPELTLIACAHGPWGEDRYFRPLLERFPRLYVDSSRYEPCGGIEDFCRHAGHERMVFGTNFPETAPGGTRLMLACADLDEAARAAIASGNLERILSEVDLS
jgi:hypothetical protein